MGPAGAPQGPAGIEPAADKAIGADVSTGTKRSSPWGDPNAAFVSFGATSSGCLAAESGAAAV